MKITGNEPVNPIIGDERTSIYAEMPDTLLTTFQNGITLKQHMVIEFTKASGFENLPNHVQATICEEDAPFTDFDNMDGGKDRYPTYGEPYVQWLLKGKVKYAIMQANEVIKQLNEEEQ